MRSTKPHARLIRFSKDILVHTPFARMVILLLALWLSFAAAVYVAERKIESSSIKTYGQAMYWGVAAFSTAGIADPPKSGTGRLIGGVWIVLGSVLFFGTIVGTVTSYFMRPMQRPHRMIIETIEYNLEQLDDLTLEEMDLLKETVDGLIDHVEHIKERASKEAPASE